MIDSNDTFEIAQLLKVNNSRLEWIGYRLTLIICFIVGAIVACLLK